MYIELGLKLVLRSWKKRVNKYYVIFEISRFQICEYCEYPIDWWDTYDTSYFLILVATTMKFQVLMFLVILLMDAELVSGCECNGLQIYDGNSGRQIGQCLTTLGGRYWCYVNPYSGCYDAKKSSRTTGSFQLEYSFLACNNLKEPPAYKKKRSIFFRKAFSA